MRRIFIIKSFLFGCIYFCGILFTGLSQTPSSQPGDWFLIFEDHFDDELSTKWKVEHEFDHYGEPQVYTNRPENVFVRNISGNNYLVLKTYREEYACRKTSPGGCNKLKYDFTSGWVETKKEYNVHYGYMEARIKIPVGKGIWPAFWTFRGEGVRNRHNSAEIDIFEMDGKRPAIQGTNLHLDYNAPNFKAPSFPEEIDVQDYSSDFHTYGLKWTPTNICWYFDNREIRKTANPGIVDPVRIILNVAIFPWELPDSDTRFPVEFLVDYVKVFRYKNPEFVNTWEDNLSGKIDHAFLKRNDRIYKGDFVNGDGKDELLILFEDGKYAEMYSFQKGNWALKWTNRGRKNIGEWQMKEDDSYIIGDFNGDDKDDLLIISVSSGWMHMYSWEGNAWKFQWNNSKKGKIKKWHLNPGDRFIPGDFENDDKDGLLLISAETNKMQLYSFTGDDWLQKWSFKWKPKTGNTALKPENRFVSGDFTGDGQDELLLVPDSTGTVGLFSFDMDGWKSEWQNMGPGKIDGWNISQGDLYLIGDFNKDGKDELFCMSDSSNVQLFNFNHSEWQLEWTNDGLGNLGGILLDSPGSYKILNGCFFEKEKSDIFLLKYPEDNCNKISQSIIRYDMLY